MDLNEARPPRSIAQGEGRYRLALQAGRMGTWFWDRSSDELDWDAELERVFGVEPGTFGGTFEDYLRLLHPDDVAPTVAAIEHCVRTGGEHYIEHRVLLPDGGIRWVSGSGRAITDAAGEVLAMMGVGADITEQRAAQEARQAAEAATAIARDAAFRAQARLAMLGRISFVLGASLDVQTTLQQVADVVVGEGLADWCTVELVEGHGIRRAAIAHRDRQAVALAQQLQREYPPQLRADRGLGKVLRTGEPEFWPSIPIEAVRSAARDDRHRELLEDLHLTAAMVVPLRARGRVLGGITLIGAEGRTFDEEDLRAAVLVGQRSAMAIDNAHLYTERARVASTLQRSLLPPRLPEVPGLDLAAFYRPGTPELGLGGDFYDVFPVDEQHWRLVIGDVCGKGAEAAALTGALRYAVRTAAALIERPDEMLAATNATICADDWAGRFATLSVVGLDLGVDPCRLTVSSGGHPPPLLRRRDGSVHPLEVPGTLVGLLSDARFAQAAHRLEPGDALLLYTDGATEAGPRDDQFGQGRLARALAAAEGSAQQVVDAVARAVEEHSSRSPAEHRSDDDVALLVATVLPRA